MARKLGLAKEWDLRRSDLQQATKSARSKCVILSSG